MQYIRYSTSLCHVHVTSGKCMRRFPSTMIGAGFNGRDMTFFRAFDGALTDYTSGVLYGNAAWTAWRALVFHRLVCLSIA